MHISIREEGYPDYNPRLAPRMSPINVHSREFYSPKGLGVPQKGKESSFQSPRGVFDFHAPGPRIRPCCSNTVRDLIS